MREQNKLLDGMVCNGGFYLIHLQGIDFDRAGSMLSRTMRQLTALTETERGRNYIFYTAMFFVFIITIVFIRAIF